MFWKSKNKNQDLQMTETSVTHTNLPLEDRDKLAETKIVRMLKFLKEKYDYDGVDYYHYQKPYSQYADLSIFDLALGSVTDKYLVKYGLDDDSSYAKSFKEVLLNKFYSIKIVHLFRSYGVTRRSAYLFIYTTCDDDNNIRVIIPDDYNFSNLFDVKEYNDPFLTCIDKNYITKYVEFKEFVDGAGNYKCGLESVNDILFNVSGTGGCISFNTDDQNNSRFGKLCVRYYPDDVDYDIDYKIDYQLSYGKKIIKQSVVDDYFLNRSIENFIFPLNQPNQRLDEFGLTPSFTEEYMSQDFTDFLTIKDMLKI
jgi:hypothetical protein